MRRRWGDEVTAGEMVQRRRLEWLRHVAMMPDHRSWNPQVIVVWMAVTISPTGRPMKEMEGCDQERPEGAED